MAHTIVQGEGLVTRYAAAPRVLVSTARNGRPGVRLEYSSTAAVGGQPFRVTELTFSGVVEFRWEDFEFGLQSGNKEDVSLSLIQIADSSLIRRLLERGKFASFPPGERLGGVLGESDLRHYRITFDDHGTYDLLCTNLEITYSLSDDDDRFP